MFEKREGVLLIINMKYIRKNNIYTKKIGGKWYILENNKRTMRELNDVASFIWELLSKELTIEDLVKKVCKEYQVNVEVAKKDILKFITEYAKEGYIIAASGAET